MQAIADMPDVIMFGSHTRSWLAALGEQAEVWAKIGVRLVRTLPGNDAAEIAAVPGANTVLIPVMERHIQRCPKGLRSLFPSQAAIEHLADKAAFAKYVERIGLTHLCPETYTGTPLAYPCVLKRTDLNAGHGVVIVESAEHLQFLLTDPMWSGQSYLLQEYIFSPADFATYSVFKDGEMLWHRSYRITVDPPGAILGAGVPVIRQRMDASDDVLEKLYQFLRPLRYSGPVNFDYKFDEKGRLRVLEINPRLGGSLMLPENVDHLSEALQVVIAHAC